AAQTSTSDGVQAIVRGDYGAAVAILRPLAERPENPDPLAQFLLASLYKAGLGVTGDWFRACGLYLRAAAQPNPLMKQAAAMAESIHHYHTVALGACTDASVGVWRQPESAVFELDSGHRVRIDQSGVTIEFSGAPTRQRISLGGANWVFLPTRYTRIDIPQPARHQRHFIEF